MDESSYLRGPPFVKVSLRPCAVTIKRLLHAAGASAKMALGVVFIVTGVSIASGLERPWKARCCVSGVADGANYTLLRSADRASRSIA
jgi:hypothetical protein